MISLIVEVDIGAMLRMSAISLIVHAIPENVDLKLKGQVLLNENPH